MLSRVDVVNTHSTWGSGDHEAGAPSDALGEAALECGYDSATVAELCRYFYEQSRPGELGEEQAAEMAGA
jgi:hypothetical protein